ncbi:MAG: hypothetical protein ACOCX9_02285 [Spirochaetota bacterium]
MNLSATPVISVVSNIVINGLGTKGKWYEFSFDYKNIDRHLVMVGIQTAGSAFGSKVDDLYSGSVICKSG